jgi:murein DD-endopeptidase MepM/ murein hydrolase activator NlpD
MALPTASALPAAPTGIGAADPDIQKQYSESIDKVLSALENRGGTNWFQIAGALANPGRTGSASEAFGRAMDVVGQQREEEEKNALPIAQMRASLVGQKYEMQKQAKAMQGLEAMTNGVPQMITAADLPTIAKTLNLEVDDPKLTQLVGQPKAPCMSGSGQSVIGVTAQPTFTKDEVNQAMIASKYDPSGAMKMLFERNTKWGEPSTMQKDIGYIMNPNTPPLARQIAFNKVNAEAVKANVDIVNMFGVMGQEGMDVFNQLSGGSPIGGTTTSAAPKVNYDFSPIADGLKLTSPAGVRNGAPHNGIDLGGVTRGTPVASPIAGEVVYAGNSKGAAGNMVTVRAEDGSLHSLMHLDGVNVAVGDQVESGTPVGPIGATGNARGVHVHYEVKGADGKPINPLNNFKIETASTNQAPSADALRLGYEKISASEYRLPFSGTIFTIDPNLPIKEKNDMLKAAVANEQLMFKAMTEEEIKAYGAKRAELIKMQPYSLTKEMGDYTNLVKYLTSPEYKNVVGILQQKQEGSNETILGKFMNGLKALGAGGEQGIAAGRLGSVSLPIEQMVNTYNLSERERTALNEIQRIVKSGLISTIGESGKVLGMNPTDPDRMLFEAAAASTSNLAANTIYWAQMRHAQTEFLRDAAKGIRAYTGQHPAAYFTSNTSPYFKAESAFENKMGMIQKNAPGLQ